MVVHLQLQLHFQEEPKGPRKIPVVFFCIPILFKNKCTIPKIHIDPPRTVKYLYLYIIHFTISQPYLVTRNFPRIFPHVHSMASTASTFQDYMAFQSDSESGPNPSGLTNPGASSAPGSSRRKSRLVFRRNRDLTGRIFGDSLWDLWGLSMGFHRTFYGISDWDFGFLWQSYPI